jgi:hypothetical protein
MRTRALSVARVSCSWTPSVMAAGLSNRVQPAGTACTCSAARTALFVPCWPARGRRTARLDEADRPDEGDGAGLFTWAEQMWP